MRLALPGPPLQEVHPCPVIAIAASQGLDRVASGCLNGKNVEQRAAISFDGNHRPQQGGDDPNDQPRRLHLPRQRQLLKAVAYCPDNPNLVACAYIKGIVRFWNTSREESGRPRVVKTFRLNNHQRVTAMDWVYDSQRDCSYLAVAAGGQLVVWKLLPSTPSRLVSRAATVWPESCQFGDSDSIQSVKFSQGGRYLAVGTVRGRTVEVVENVDGEWRHHTNLSFRNGAPLARDFARDPLLVVSWIRPRQRDWLVVTMEKRVKFHAVRSPVPVAHLRQPGPPALPPSFQCFHIIELPAGYPCIRAVALKDAWITLVINNAVYIRNLSDIQPPAATQATRQGVRELTVHQEQPTTEITHVIWTRNDIHDLHHLGVTSASAQGHLQNWFYEAGPAEPAPQQVEIVDLPQEPWTLVFISFAGEQREVATRLFHDLHHHGFAVFLDNLCLLPSSLAPRIMENAAQRAHIMVSLVSPDYCFKEAPMWELRTFWERPNDRKGLLIPIFYNMPVQRYRMSAENFRNTYWDSLSDDTKHQFHRRQDNGENNILERNLELLRNVTRITGLEEYQMDDNTENIVERIRAAVIMTKQRMLVLDQLRMRMVYDETQGE